MRHNIKQLLLLIFMVGFSFTYSLSADSKKTTITLGTFNYPPLMIQDVSKGNEAFGQGMGIEFVKRAFKDHPEFTLEIEFYPVKRSMKEFEKRNTDIFLGSRMDLPSITEEIIPVKIFPLKSVLFCYKEDCNSIENKRSFKNLGSIASIPGSPVNKVLREMGNKVIIIDTLDLTFEFWLSGRADYVAAIDFAGYYSLHKMDLLDSKNIKSVTVDILKIPYDAVVRKDNPLAEKILKALREEQAHPERAIHPREVLREYTTPRQQE